MTIKTNIRIFLPNTLEAVQQLTHFMFMDGLELPVSHTITEHDDAVWQDLVHGVVLLQCSWSTML